jgi:hypothetical protein
MEQLARRLPPPLTRAMKRIAAYPRFWLRARRSRRGYRHYGDRYPQPLLFVAGLPKSGTSWLERMLASYPGYELILPPQVTAYELDHTGSEFYELPAGLFRGWRHMLAITKMHVHGSAHNVRVLRDAGVRYVVLYRDLRDVAVSYYFYVRNTPWHPQYERYQDLAPQDALLAFGTETAATYAAWVRSWDTHRDPQASLMLRYEDLLQDPAARMTTVARLFQLDDAPETIAAIVEEHAFRRLSGGRVQGQTNPDSFFRKGVAGDWRNYFSPALRHLYKDQIGDFLVAYGYEKDDNW